MLRPRLSEHGISYAALCSGVYAALGIVWITISDRVAELLIPETAQASIFQSSKGCLFVGLSALAIYQLLRRTERQERVAQPQSASVPGQAAPGIPVVSQLVLLVLAVSVPLCALLGWSIYRSAEDEVRNAKRLVADLAAITARDTARFIGDTSRTMAALAQRPRIRALDPHNCDPVLADVPVVNASFLNAITFDAAGSLVCSALPIAASVAEGLPREVSHQRVMREKRFILSEPLQGQVASGMVVIAGAPVHNSLGDVSGSINLAIRIESLRPVVRPALAAEGIIGIVNADGRIIYGATPERRGRDGRDAGIVRLAVAQKKGEAMMRGFDGVMRSFSFAPVEGTDWIAIAGVPTSVIYGQARENAWRGGLIGLLIILLAAVAGTWMSRRIAGPILGIADAAQRVAGGELAVRAPEGGSREVTAVARQFNAMLDVLPLIEDELRESEQRYKSLFDSSPECVFVHAEGRIVMMNRAGARLYGAASPQQMVGMLVADLAHPDDRAEVEGRVHAVGVERREAALRELKNIRLDGSTIEVEVMSLPFEYGGEPAVLTQLRDITARKSAEARVARLSNLYAALSHTNEAMVRESGRADLCRAVCRIIVEQGGMVTAAIRLRDFAGDAFVPVASHGPVSNWVGERTIAAGETGSRVVRAIDSKRTYVLNDIFAQPDGRFGLDDMRALGIGSLAILPILVDGKGVGGLSVFAAEAGFFDPELIALLEEMMRNLSYAFVKLESEQALQESELRYRVLVEASPDAIGVLVRGKIVLANSAALALFGAAAPAQLIGRQGYELTHPDYRAAEREAVREVMRSPGKVLRAEVRQLRLDGSVFDAEIVRSRFEYRGQPALQVISRDISERKEAERRISRLTHLYAALSQTNAAIARAASREELFAKVCRVAVENGHFVTALISMLNPARDLAVPVGAYGRLAGLIGERPLPLTAGMPGADGPAAIAIREATPQVSNDLLEDPRARASVGDLVRTGIRAVAVCPLQGEGEVSGALIVYADEPGFFDAELVGLLKEMAQNISFGLAKLQSEAARHTSEGALRDSEARYRSLFDTSPLCIYVRQDDRVVMMNPAGLALFGATSPEQIIGRPSADLVHPDFRELANQRYRFVMHGEDAAPATEFKNLRLDGTLLETESVVTPFEFEGRPAVQIITNDISVRKEAERALRRLNSELEQRVQQRTAELSRVNQELSEFSYIVSHDLKAPLRGVASLVDWLKQDHGEQLGPEGRELLRLLSARSRRMHRLIEDILHFSRLGRGRESAAEIDLDHLLHEIVDSLDLPPHIAVRVAALPRLVGDETRLRQVFQNLISNAAKFMDKEKGLIEVGVDPVPAQTPGGTPAWRFYVADNGPGIEARHHQRIFEIFQTLHPRDDPDSTGIGLTVVKKIVELLGGGIWVESELGKGARFVFTLPCRDAIDMPAREGAHERPDTDLPG
ncbi:MAG: sensor histidine kinase [Betaproteobacteria bacterium]|nr:sensor histidine kinase [Betaproteobacteria bacterium]